MNFIRNAALGAAALLMSTLTISAASANPNTNEQRQPQASAQGASQQDRQICVMNEAVSGSRLARRVCRTEREWIATEGAVPGRD